MELLEGQSIADGWRLADSGHEATAIRCGPLRARSVHRAARDRDMKPTKLQRNGVNCAISLARAATVTPTKPPCDAAGDGSAPYMAPEQVGGKTWTQVGLFSGLCCKMMTEGRLGHVGGGLAARGRARAPRDDRGRGDRLDASSTRGVESCDQRYRRRGHGGGSAASNARGDPARSTGEGTCLVVLPFGCCVTPRKWDFCIPAGRDCRVVSAIDSLTVRRDARRVRDAHGLRALATDLGVRRTPGT